MGLEDDLVRGRGRRPLGRVGGHPLPGPTRRTWCARDSDHATCPAPFPFGLGRGMPTRLLWWRTWSERECRDRARRGSGPATVLTEAYLFGPTAYDSRDPSSRPRR